MHFYLALDNSQKDGELTTAFSNVVEGGYTAPKQLTNVAFSGDVELNLTGAANYTKEDYAAVAAKLTNVGTEKLHLKGGQFVGKNGTLAALDDVKSVGNDVENSPVTAEVAGGAKMTVVPTADKAIVGSVTVTRAANSTSKIEDLTIGAAGTGITLRGYNGAIVNVADADKHDTKFKLVLDNVTLGQEDSDTASYNDVVEIGAEGLTIGGGSFTLGDIAGATSSGPLNITGGDLTLVGTAGQTVEYTAADGTKKSYTTTTFGRTVTPAVSPDTNPTIADYDKTVTLSGGHFLALGNYAMEAAAARQALVEEAIANYIEDNGSADEDDKRRLDQSTNVFYVGQQSYLGSGITSTDDVYTLMDLSKIAAGAGYTSDLGIVEVQAGSEGSVTGTVKQIRLSNITDKVVNVDDYGVASINVGKMFNSHTFVFDTSFYENGLTVSNGLAVVVADESQLALAQLMGFNSFGTLNQAVRGYNVPTDQITNAIYKNFADWQEDAQTYADEKAIAS